MPGMERDLAERERAVLTLLASAEKPGAEVVRESLPHLRVTGGCGCGCESFEVRDVRQPEGTESGIEDWSGAVSEDGLTNIVLFVDADGRPTSVDILTPNQGRLPDPQTLRLAPDAERA
jgi:hypothetical protein